MKGRKIFPDQEYVQQLRRENEILRQECAILKQRSGHLQATKKQRFRFIADHQHVFPIIHMCEVLNVSSSGFYAWQKRLSG